MRLSKYITESELPTKEEADKAKDLIAKNCSEITKLYKKYNKVFYRGTKHNKNFVEKTGRVNDRDPRNTDIEIHDQLNRFFKKKFGWNVRDGISTSNTLKQTQFFATANGGRSYVFFPKNGFKYCWSKTFTDLYNESPIAKVKTATWSNEELEEWMDKYMSVFKNIVNTYTDKDLDKVLRIGNTNFESRKEIMFKSNKYYLVSLPLFGMISL